MAQPKAGIHEKLTWFWHGHLTTSHDKVFNWRLEFPEHRLLRTHALGNFRALLQAITVDPAMLVYLDGDGSNAIDPNENYGRELMELFCLGRAQYTQADDRVLVATTSEFGRRVPDNASNGLDHGAGSFALVAGAPAAPGLHGSYPDLAALDADDNLIATVDLWDYYATLAEAWLGVPASSVLGPGATPIPGLIAA